MRKSSTCFDFREFQKIGGMSADCNQSFLEWFVGMWEGDGSLIKRERGDLYFVITQCNSDKQILDYMRSVLGFGSVNAPAYKVSRLLLTK